MISFQTLSYYLFSFFSATFNHNLKSAQARAWGLFGIHIVFHSLLFFYSKKHFVVLIALLLINYVLLKLMHKNKHLRLSLSSLQIIFVVSCLCFFKYSIFNTPILGVLPFLGPLLKPATFIGISFFSFKMISVAVDMKRGTLKNPLSFIHYANFVLFFPCFLSGPLDRYDNFVGSFSAEEKPEDAPQRIFDGIFRIIWGAFKKGVVADSLYGISLVAFSDQAVMELPIWKVLMALYIYSWVLYIDFSGYSDIAIGISRLFRVKTPENFNNPYFSRNLQEFWNSWHISFMHWLRDYVYYPIQMFLLKRGVRAPVSVACFAFMVVFFIAGVWHGDTLHYSLYGLSHGLSFAVFLVYKKVLEGWLSKEQIKSYNQSRLALLFGVFLTYNYFTLSLLFFLDKWHFWNRLF